MIVKPPSNNTNQEVSAFIGGAPDRAAPVVEMDDTMTQISLRVGRADLAKIDAEAKRRRMPRASFIRMVVFDAIG